MPNNLDRRFLDHFPQEQRSTVANMFLGVVRSDSAKGETHTATLVRDDARAEGAYRLQTAFRYGDTQAIAKWQGILSVLARWPDEAWAYAQWCLDYEAMPYEERQRLKAEHMQEAREMAMAAKPVTEKQAAFIRSLGGDPATVTTAREASQLIDRLKSGRP